MYSYKIILSLFLKLQGFLFILFSLLPNFDNSRQLFISQGMPSYHVYIALGSSDKDSLCSHSSDTFQNSKFCTCHL